MSRTETKPPSGGESAAPKAAPAVPRRRESFMALVLVALGLAGFVASRLARLWPGFDVFSHFELHAAIVVAAGLTGYFMPRPKGAFALGFLVFGLVLYGLWPNLPPHQPDAKAPDGMRSLRVAAFNVGSANETPQQLTAALRRLDADVVFLSELTAGSQPALQGLAATWPYAATCTDFSVCDTAILSKYPLREFTNNLDADSPSYVLARLGPEFGNTLLASLHTARFPHLRLQQRQLASFAAVVEQRPGPKIIGGDFNATTTSRVLADFTANLGLRRTTALPTWPARFDLPLLAIDHFLVGGGVGTLGPESLGFAAGSDHFPIIQTFSLPGNS